MLCPTQWQSRPWTSSHWKETYVGNYLKEGFEWPGPEVRCVKGKNWWKSMQTKGEMLKNDRLSLVTQSFWNRTELISPIIKSSKKEGEGSYAGVNVTQLWGWKGLWSWLKGGEIKAWNSSQYKVLKYAREKQYDVLDLDQNGPGNAQAEERTLLDAYLDSPSQFALDRSSRGPTSNWWSRVAGTQKVHGGLNFHVGHFV